MNDLVETTGSAFLGLTLACCRCHHHKFDPISQADYYRLRAFFEGVQFADDLPLDLASKQEAWQILMHDADRPNYELYAIAEGFWHPLQEDVTVLFVEPYFTDVAELAKIHSGWVLARLAGYTYPWTAVSPLTVELTDQLLARTDLDAGVRRSVVDAGDDLRRAVAARRLS